MINFTCPRCESVLEAPDRKAGAKVACPKCQQRLQIPTPPRNKTIRFACPSCGMAVSAPEDCAGRSTECHRCNGPIVVPGSETHWSEGSQPPPVRCPVSAQTNHLPKWYYTHGGGQQQAPVSWEELCRMANDGRLGPDDLVKEERESGWARADSFPELCPEVIEADEPVEVRNEPSPLRSAKPRRASVLESPLTDCKVCGQEIAKEATTCPGCGATNRWTHPSIVRFLKRLHWFEDIPNFEVEARGYVLVGKSTRPKQFLDVAADAVGGLGFRSPMTVGGLIGLLGMSIGAVYTSDALRKLAGNGQQVFSINFRHGQPIWRSTDDKFWYDVMEFFKL